MRADDRYFQSDDFQSLLHRYERSLCGEASGYFEADDFLDLSDFYFDNNKMDEALQAANRGLQLHPSDDQLPIAKAGVLIQMRAFDEALAIMRSYDGDKHGEILYLQAQIELGRDHDLKAADVNFRMWIDYREKLYKEDMSASQEDEDDEDGEDDEDDYDSDPEESLRDAYQHVALSIQEYADSGDESLNLLRSWLERYKDRFETLGQYDSDIDMMWVAYDAEQYDLEALFCEKILETDPYSKDVWTQLAYASYMTGDEEKAVNAADFALAINPEDSDAMAVRANCYFDNGDYANALDLYNGCGKFLSEADEVRRSWSAAYLGHNDEALKSLDATFEHIMANLANDSIDDHEQPLYELGTCYMYLDEYDKAFLVIRRALGKSPTNLAFIKMQGDWFLAKGDQINAQKSYEYVLTNSQRAYADSFHIALSFLAYGPLSAACRVLQTLTEMETPEVAHTPERKALYAYLAYSNLLALKLNKALAALDVALRECPDLMRDLLKPHVPDTVPNSMLHQYIREHFPDGLSLKSAKGKRDESRPPKDGNGTSNGGTRTS